jgi:hypothetical protein
MMFATSLGALLQGLLGPRTERCGVARRRSRKELLEQFGRWQNMKQIEGTTERGRDR